jgi:hypothetical protein
MPLFCGEDLNFGAFSKYFPLGKQISSILDRHAPLLSRRLVTRNYAPWWSSQAKRCRDSNQSAYRRNHSCETTVISILDVALRAADRGEVMIVVLLDLSAAFDT